MTFKYDTSETGLNAFFKDYQILALRVLWETKGAGSKDVWLKVNQMLKGKTISRPSIINFLENMRKKGVVKGEKTTGKGGHYYIYSMEMDESGFKTYLVRHMIEALMNNFERETMNVIENL